MADTYSVTYNAKMEVRETVDVDLDHAPDPTITHESTAVAGTLTGSTDPKIEVFWSSLESIASGATTNLDLTALVRDNLPNVDMTDKKVNLVKLVASATNTTHITVDENVATGYNLFDEISSGGGTHQIVLYPGDCYFMYAPETRAVVAVGEKDFDLTNSAGATATIELMIGAGVT